MNQHQIHSPNRFRVLSMTGILILLFVATSLMAKELSQTASGNVAGFVAGFLLAPIIASPIEWLVHRHIYHRTNGIARRIFTIHSAHHHLYFPTWRYVTGGRARRIPILGVGVSNTQDSALKNGVTYFAHFSFYLTLGAAFIWAPMWLLSTNTVFLVGGVLATIIISNLFITVHDAIHRPGTHPWMEARGWFHFLDDHHYIHHVDTEANVNFLLPLADWLYGSLRRELTEEEISRYGSKEVAKSRVVGAGKPARQSEMLVHR